VNQVEDTEEILREMLIKLESKAHLVEKSSKCSVVRQNVEIFKNFMDF